MKFLALLSPFFLFYAHAFTLTEYQKTPKNKSHLSTVINRYPQDQLMKNLRSFASCCRPSRLVGLEGNEQAASFLENFLKEKKTGVTTIHQFQFSASKPRLNSLNQMQKNYFEGLHQKKAKNLIWEKKGSEAISASEEILIFSAYYDNMTIDQKNQKIDTTSLSLGADNNASGVAALLSLIEMLDIMPLKNTIRVIFHNYGQWSSFGLNQYFLDQQKELSRFKKIHHIQAQTLGHSSARTHQLKKENQLKLYVTKTSDQPLAEEFLKASAAVWGPVELSVGELKNIPSFTTKDLPHAAHLTLSGDLEMDPNPRHFTTDDFVETINSSFYAQNFKILSAMAISWAFDLEN